MSAPGFSPPSVSPDRQPFVVASVAAVLAVVGVIAHFLTWRTLTASFAYGDPTREITFDSSRSGLKFERSITAVDATGSSNIGSYSATYPVPLILFVILAAAGIALLAMAKAPRVGAALTAVAGAVLAGMAGFMMSLAADELFGSPDVDIANFSTFYDQTLENGELSTGAGAYLGLVVGLLLIAFGIYAAIRPATASAAPAPQQAYPPFQQPNQPTYDPAAHGQHPPQGWPGYPAQQPGYPAQQPGYPAQPMPPQQPQQDEPR